MEITYRIYFVSRTFLLIYEDYFCCILDYGICVSGCSVDGVSFKCILRYN